MAVTVKLVAELVVPEPVVIDIFPVVEPGITIATNVLPSFEIIIGLMPPKVMFVGLSSEVPLIVTNEPIEPAPGEKEVITGWATIIFAHTNKISNNEYNFLIVLKIKILKLRFSIYL